MENSKSQSSEHIKAFPKVPPVDSAGSNIPQILALFAYAQQVVSLL